MALAQQTRGWANKQTNKQKTIRKTEVNLYLHPAQVTQVLCVLPPNTKPVHWNNQIGQFGFSKLFSSPYQGFHLRRHSEESLCLRQERLSWFAHDYPILLGRDFPWPPERGHCSSGWRLLWDALWLSSTLAKLTCHSNNIYTHHWFPCLTRLLQAWCDLLFFSKLCISSLCFLKISPFQKTFLIKFYHSTTKSQTCFFCQYTVVIVFIFIVSVPCFCYLIVSSF